MHNQSILEENDQVVPSAEQSGFGDHPSVALLLALWHLFSLDAPTVAVVWLCFTASLSNTPVPTPLPAAMALSVWILYVADRLVDSYSSGFKARSLSTELQLRHRFHYRYRRFFIATIWLAVAVLIFLVPKIPSSTVHPYLFEGSLVGTYFLLVHRVAASPKSGTSVVFKVPKEFLVGPFFSAAVFIPCIAYRPEAFAKLLPSTILFSGLCCLNCLYIYAWEHDSTGMACWLTARAVGQLRKLSIVFVLTSLFLFALGPADFRLYSVACVISAVALMTLNRFHRKFSGVTLRAAADFTLLSPLLLTPFLHRAL